MKKIQLHNRVTKPAFEVIGEDVIKRIMATELSKQLSEIFFEDLQLKRNADDTIHAIDYSYNLIILEAQQYNNIMFKLQKLIEYVKTKKSDDQLLYMLVDLKNEMLEKPNT